MIDPENNKNEYMNKSMMDVSMDVSAVAMYYPGFIKVWVPNTPMRKLLPDWEIRSKANAPINTEKTTNETDLERSIRRSQKSVSDYVHCNRFDLFATFTIGSERYNPDQSKNKVHNWIKNQRNRNGKFRYILVPEYHKDSALHFHALIGDYSGEVKRSVNFTTGKYLVRNKKPVYELPAFKSGFTKVQYIGQTAEDHAKVGNYIRKYITKDMISIFNQKRYWTSQNLHRPLREDNPDWYFDIKADDIFENEYGKILTYADLDTKTFPAYIHLLTGNDHL
jgi:hypothetical protein